MSEAVGSANFWGFSGPVALNALTTDLSQDASSSGSSRGMLVAGSGDIRHVLATVAYARVHASDCSLNEFFMLESNPETYARMLLMLHLILEPPEDMSGLELVEMLLELHGSGLIRRKTNDIVRQRANTLLDLVCDPEALQAEFPQIRIDWLKFKERDMLSGIFKFWRDSDEQHFDIRAEWDKRLRSLHKARYDHRENLADWDYNMHLLERLPLLKQREFAQWRDSSVAFDLRQADYVVSNRTLASGAIVKTAKGSKAVRGFWGDVVVGPFASFGSHCRHPNLLKTQNGKLIKSLTDASVYTLCRLLHEAVHGTRFDGVPNADTPGTEGLVLETWTKESARDLPFRVTFLPMVPLEKLAGSAKYKGLADSAFVGSSIVHQLDGPAQPVFAERAVLFVENANYFPFLNDDQRRQFVEQIDSKTDACGFRRCERDWTRACILDNTLDADAARDDADDKKACEMFTAPNIVAFQRSDAPNQP